MKQKIYQLLVELTNGKGSSKVLQRVTKSNWSRKLISSYIHTYGIDMKEVSKPAHSFDTLHDFFIRQLDVQYRPIAEGDDVVVSPVDARIESVGSITSNGTFIVKDKSYTVSELLGNNDYASFYEGGMYAVFYLSPADYHRIHSPVHGHIKKQVVLGEKSYPVNRAGLTYGKAPISGNYRHVSHVICQNQKKCAVIKVGAMFVNSIQLTNQSREWIKGEEIGYFTFGSTVVLLFEKDAFSLEAHIKPNTRVRVGEKIGSML
jgi:phosphatidylserine decarboxylase